METTTTGARCSAARFLAGGCLVIASLAATACGDAEAYGGPGMAGDESATLVGFFDSEEMGRITLRGGVLYYARRPAAEEPVAAVPSIGFRGCSRSVPAWADPAGLSPDGANSWDPHGWPAAPAPTPPRG